MKVTVAYEGPIPAPIPQGAEVGTLRVEGPDMEPITRPLRTAESVDQLDFFGRITSAVNYIVFGAGGS